MTPAPAQNILGIFSREMESVSKDHLKLLEPYLEEVKETDTVLLDRIPESVLSIVALAGEYRKRAAQAKFDLAFDPAADKVALEAAIIAHDEKSSVLGHLWWLALKEASGAWSPTLNVQIRKGWKVVIDAEPASEQIKKDVLQKIAHYVGHLL